VGKNYSKGKSRFLLCSIFIERKKGKEEKRGKRKERRGEERRGKRKGDLAMTWMFSVSPTKSPFTALTLLHEFSKTNKSPTI
jgi:hypothetical protein